MFKFVYKINYKMKNVIFLPWVGKKYLKTKDKVLVLGLSHYSDTDFTEPTDFTTDIINLYLNYKNGNESHERWMNTFTRFTNILNNRQVEVQEVENFWNSVVFYNYVQRAIYDGPRHSPSEEDFEKSHKAFIEIIEKYKPDTIIVWADELWNHIPKEYISLDEKSKVYQFKKGAVNADMLTIYHPSSTKFSYDYWQNIENKPNSLQDEQIKKLLEL